MYAMRDIAGVWMPCWMAASVPALCVGVRTRARHVGGRVEASGVDVQDGSQVANIQALWLGGSVGSEQE